MAYTNRYGALIRGSVFAPLPGARDPYTGRRLRRPYPGVVITTGSVQGSERMYWWLAQDLAERGYVVLTYDVQGQGTSETLPHENDQVNAVPFCNPFAEPAAGEDFGCPGVPAQQDSNFVYGTQDALSFFLSTPRRPYRNRNAGDTQVNAFNPLWRLFDRTRDRRTRHARAHAARGDHRPLAGRVGGVRTCRASTAACETVVALDKLHGEGRRRHPGPTGHQAGRAGLAVQSEYGFNVQPYWMQHGSSIQPKPGPPNRGARPAPRGGDGLRRWRAAGVDSMLVVPRASTHLEYTDIAFVLPASRYGQALTSVYVQRWLEALPQAPPLAACSRRASATSSRWTWADGSRSSSTAPSGSASTSAPATRSADGSSTDIAGVGGC